LLTDEQDKSGMLFRRNRYYDPTTGRFTQEDPIGLAGGLNLYGFAAGDPINYSDPFGLRVCFKGNSDQDVRELRQAAEAATNTTITLDKSNCVKSWHANGAKGFEDLQARFGEQVASEDTYYVQFADSNAFQSNYDPATRTASLKRKDVGTPYDYGGFWSCLTGWNDQTPFDLPALFVHELLGHGTGGFWGRFQAHAIWVENKYHRAVNGRTRCQPSLQPPEPGPPGTP
jgi:RHS repeat-associated protein